MSYDVFTPTRQFRLESECVFRTYTYRQFLSLVRGVGDLSIVAIHDFGYDIDEPIELDPSVEDAVFVLRKEA